MNSPIFASVNWRNDRRATSQVAGRVEVEAILDDPYQVLGMVQVSLSSRSDITSHTERYLDSYWAK